MKTAIAPRQLRFDYERVKRRRLIMLPPWVMALVLVTGFALVSWMAVSAVVWTWNSSINRPELSVDPDEQVVKVAEADGRIYTRSTDSHFDQRVRRIRATQSYDVVYVGFQDEPRDPQ